MSIRLLIVDDSAPLRRMLALVLGAESDIEIVGEATNGAEAIEQSRRLQPDVVLLDVAMPVLDGIEALPGVSAAAPKTTVIMLSGFTGTHIRDEALAAGAWRFVEKGAGVLEISKLVREAAQVHVT